jgi:acetyl-CoA acetyltransferase family protein
MSYKSEIPYGAYWSTPFAKWQGTLQHLHSIEFGAWVLKREMAKRNIDPQTIDHGVMGITNYQYRAFHGAPWLFGLAGMQHVGGPTISQVCATGVRTLHMGVSEIEMGTASCALIAVVDRCSNGPHMYFPAPRATAGSGIAENPVLDSMSNDPLGGHSMLKTAENVAKKHGVSTSQQHEVVLRRYEQYQEALANDHAFQKRYMSLPFEVPNVRFNKIDAVMQSDEGVFASTNEGLAKLKPVMDGGTVTFGGQTHPADGSAAIIVTTSDKARELSRDPSIRVTLHGFGQARVELAHMPEAPVPAAKKALAQAGIGIKDLKAIKAHNPFAVNDLVFAKETGANLHTMNNYGCSLIWGHPQGPTGTRSIIELIEELVIAGGGYGLFQGCAAGDSGMAVVIKVDSR